jgi:hypothetical protein
MQTEHHTPQRARFHAGTAGSELTHVDLADRLALIDFKLLMADSGHCVDLKRLQIDPCYAQACLGQAIESHSTELQAAARRLCASFVLDL